MTPRQPRKVCPRCTRPVEDGLLCSVCVGAFERAVTNLAALLPELEVTIARRDEAWRAIRHRTILAAAAREPAEEAPPGFALVSHALPVNLDAADLAVAVRHTIVTRVAELRARHGDPDRRRWVVNTAGGVAPEVWLLASVPAVRRDPHARAVVDDLVVAARQVEQMVDRREPDCYVGPCDAPDVEVEVEVAEADDGPAGDEVIRVSTGRICGVDLYVRFGEASVDCPACGARYSVTERRAWLLEAAREVWARPAVIATALAALDVDLTAGRLDTWISRDKRRHERCWPGEACGHIVPVALDSDEVDEKGRPVGRPMYRVGDVLDRVESLRAERDRRAKEAQA